MTHNSSGGNLSQDEIRQIIETIRQEFEESFNTVSDPAVRQKQVEQSLIDKQVDATCEAQCMTNYANCRNSGGTQAACQAAYNACMDACIPP